MFIFFTVLIVAISLSMDTFSLSLSYGMLNISKNNILKISICVGIFHFFMPLLGDLFGEIIFRFIPVDEKALIGIIFLTISVDILFSLFKEKEISPIKTIIDIIMFSLTVSIDSFATGMCLDIFGMSSFYTVSIFMIISFFFTYLGLSLGYVIHNKIGKISELIGLTLLMILSFFYLVY